MNLKTICLFNYILSNQGAAGIPRKVFAEKMKK